ncbi:hypothetical protein BN2476_520002 [Paraburkholderia piptadeniae]|uniref:Uncharacterized protein n=1 Tax=Paraburkholderia piptadeniae TaxID=1701573 RepID=A0A1N7SGS8_9BURK|nr:hypothetical protein BN2476_520002 [Paraburkholderia piptadeniae]
MLAGQLHPVSNDITKQPLKRGECF